MSETSGPPAEGSAGDVGGQPPYGYGAPLAPVGYEALQPPAGPPPPQVELAARLMFVNVAVQLVSMVASLTMRRQILDRVIAKGNGSLTAEQLRTSANLALGVGIGFSIILVVLYALLALQLRKRKNWARVTTIVFASLGVLSLFNVLVPTTVGLLKVVGLVTFAVNLTILLQLTRKQVSRWFKPRRPGY
jgi:hypothetical protein